MHLSTSEFNVELDINVKITAFHHIVRQFLEKYLFNSVQHKNINNTVIIIKKNI